MCCTEATFKKRYKLEMDSVEENNKGKGEKAKEKKTRGKTRESKKKIRQLFCCLIEYGELFELFPERCIFLLFLCFFAGLGIVFDEPGEELRIIDFLAEHLFAVGVEECTALVGRHSNEVFNGAIERLGAVWLERSIVATDG